MVAARMEYPKVLNLSKMGMIAAVLVGAGGAVNCGGASANARSPATPACNYSNTIQLVGNHIQDTSGAPIVARGPEMVVATTDNTLWIDTAANTGANAVRLLLTLDAANGMTQAKFDTLIARAVSHDMIVWLSLYTWDSGKNNVINTALGGGNFYSLAAPSGTGTCATPTPASCYLAVWSRQWLKDLVAKYKGHVIIDAMQEYIGVADPSTEAGRTEWASAAQTNVQWFRGADYIEPLEVMTNYQGRDLYAIIQKGASIRAVDTVVVSGYPRPCSAGRPIGTRTGTSHGRAGCCSAAATPSRAPRRSTSSRSPRRSRSRSASTTTPATPAPSTRRRWTRPTRTTPAGCGGRGAARTP